MPYFVRAGRSLVAAVLVFPILAASLAVTLMPVIAADIALPARSAMPPSVQKADAKFLYGLGPRPDLSRFDDDFRAAATIVSTANSVAAFCSSGEPAAFRDKIAPPLASVEALSKLVSAYADQVYVKRTGPSVAKDAAIYLQAEESQERAWASFIDKVAAALRAAERRVYTADVIQCAGSGKTIDAACVKVLDAFSPFVGPDGGFYLEGKSFRYERGEPGTKNHLAVNIVVRPYLKCKEGAVGVGVYSGYGPLHQSRHFSYDVVTGTMPPYPDIFPEQLVYSVQFIFDRGSKDLILNPSYSTSLPKEASRVTRIDFQFKNGLKSTSGKAETVKLSWP